jgi:metal-responsive CopG/Arc/MetJ family transcriptional regulator
MATVNFSVPEDVRQEFNHLFEKENKSAILTRLMQQAIEEKKQQQRRQLAIDKILQLRTTQAPVSAADIQQAREELRA